MSAQDDSPRELVEQAAVRLHESVARLAAQLCPFPAFLGMTSVQAIELEPPAGITGRNADLGCVVVLPDGEICELELEVIPGPMGPSDVDQVERYRELGPAARRLHSVRIRRSPRYLPGTPTPGLEPD